MGSCCYTPRKSHFLWWYWLLLASIVGIPMLIAALYVARKRSASDAGTEEIGRKAGRLFWFLTALTFIGGAISGAILVQRAVTAMHSNLGAFRYAGTFYLLVLEFLCCFILANFANRLSRRAGRIPERLAIVAGFLGLWIVVNPVANIINPGEILAFFTLGPPDADAVRPAVSALFFAACWIPAHCWQEFLHRPVRRTAWQALGAFVLASFLFYGAARYGTLGHYYAYNLARGTTPTVAEAAPYKTRSPAFPR
jgi:hypothetical protein